MGNPHIARSMSRSVVILIALLAIGLGHKSSAQVTMDFVYDPGTGDTTITYGGSWLVYTATNTGLTGGADISYLFNSASLEGGTLLRDGVGYEFMRVTDHSPTGSIPWDGNSQSTTNVSGDYVGWQIHVNSHTDFYAVASYTAGDTLSAIAIFENTSLGDLGFDSGELSTGTGTISWVNGNSVVWTATAVPEPSTYAAIFGGLVLVGTMFARHRVKRSSKT